MKKVIFLFTLLLCLTSLCHVMANDHAATNLLNEALDNMGKVNGYHALADLTINRQNAGSKLKAQIEGDFGVGTSAYTTVGFDGKQTKIIAIGSDAYVTSDGGKTWHKNVNQNAADLSQMVTGPVNPRLKLADQGAVRTIGTEDVAGTSTTHLRVAAKSPVDVWIANDAQAGKVIRKVHLTITSDDGIDFDTTVIYSDFNKQLDIKAPTINNQLILPVHCQLPVALTSMKF